MVSMRPTEKPQAAPTNGKTKSRCLWRSSPNAPSGYGESLKILVGVRDAQTVEVLKKQGQSGGPASWVDFSGAEAVIVGNLGSLTEGQAVEVK